MITKSFYTEGKEKKGFTFTEVMITLALFMVLASVGMGAYFRYYNFSLINNDIGNINKILHDTRSRAMKNATGDEYGLRLETNSNEFISFRDTFLPEHPENNVVKLERLEVTAINLAPSLGITDTIIFENTTGKTQNFGTFTVETDNFSYTFNINSQGVFE